LPVDDGRERGAPDIHERALTRDGDRLRRRAELQNHVEARLLSDFQHDPSLQRGRESLQTCPRLVPPRRETGHREVAVRVGHGAPTQAGIEVPADNGDTWQHATGFVPPTPPNVPSADLSYPLPPL